MITTHFFFLYCAPTINLSCTCRILNLVVAFNSICFRHSFQRINMASNHVDEILDEEVLELQRAGAVSAYHRSGDVRDLLNHAEEELKAKETSETEGDQELKRGNDHGALHVDVLEPTEVSGADPVDMVTPGDKVTSHMTDPAEAEMA